MKYRRWAVAGGLVLCGWLMAAPAEAQDAPPPPPPDTAELVFEREVFVYPRYNRRNPFSPLIDLEDTGPRFEELTLEGIVYSQNPNLSVALFTATVVAITAGGQQVPAEETYRLRRGQVVGNVRVIEIQPTRVIVDVDEFGVVEQRVFELQRGSGGNSP